jgi:HAD superfamily hydrolase (TIGR01549 family)
MKKRPTLRGVVLDMDGTLTIPNLNFSEMYDRCGIDAKDDILQVLAALPEHEAAPKYKIIEEMEDHAVNTMQVMPGAPELMAWLQAHQIPTALVTRNTSKSAEALKAKLGNLDIIIARDTHADIAPKPDPAAMHYISNLWKITDPSSLIMVGDSPANDIGFGKRAGTFTALLDTGRKTFDADKSTETADIVVDQLCQFPRHLWMHFEFDGGLGTHSPLKKYPVPTPSNPTTCAAVEGSIQGMVSDHLHTPDESGNTPLIWAADAGHAHVVEHLLGLLQESSSSGSSSIDARGYLGTTALCRAARRGHSQVLELLLQAGADPNICNDKMQYPLHFAAFKENMEAVQVLLAHKTTNLRVLDRKGRIPADDTKSDDIRNTILAAMV